MACAGFFMRPIRRNASEARAQRLLLIEQSYRVCVHRETPGARSDQYEFYKL